jgi:mannose-6-phosphate isomerase
VAGIAVLKNKIHEYAWGSKSFIPELIGVISPSGQPRAEMWMGSHSKASSVALYDDCSVSLDRLIADDPAGTLGLSVAKKFSNNLPFLFKVLAAEKPLSIQAHPNKEQAKTGFLRENREKIDLDAPERNYRDENHKPELICALEPLWALKGFREIKDIIELRDRIGVAAEGLGTDILKRRPDKEGLRGFFISLMNKGEDKKQYLLEEIIQSVKDIRSQDSAFEWIYRLNMEYPGDIGALSPLFLNVVQLQPKEAMYIPSGELHAYLGGAGLELMANSDNVLRGGLTVKHIDLSELSNILDFSPHAPEILRPEDKGGALELIYPVKEEEFMLSALFLHGNDSVYTSPVRRSAEIIICLKGEATIEDKGTGDILDIKKGMSMFIPASVKQYLIKGKAIIYKASVPL